MRNKLIAAIDAHFANAPRTAQVQELHDEILQNTLDRYDEELAAGKTETEAFNAALAAVGDIDELLRPLCPVQKTFPAQRAVAIALYILCVIPVIVGDALGGIGDTVGVCLMFVIAAAATTLIVWPQKQKATRERKLRAVGIGLYVLCVTPPILFDEVVGGPAGDALGVSLMFVIVAIATVLVILSARRNPNEAPADAQSAPCAAQKEPASTAQRIATVIYWLAAVFAFFAIGNFVSWFYAWVIFPAAGGLADVISGVVRLTKGERGMQRILSGTLWILASVAYLKLTLATGKWPVTWLVFPIAGAVTGALSGIFDLVKGSNTL